MQNNVFRFFLRALVLILIFSGCGQEKRTEKEPEKTVDLSNFKETTSSGPRSISYEMTLPVEMAGLFDHVGANFYPEFLNPADQFGKYGKSAKVALNLGVYGVDLSYVKMFSQHQRSVAYLNAIHRLAGEMGIPREIYGDVIENMEFFVTNRDSLSKVTMELYSATDEFLKEDGQEGAASLVAMGGWIESMYIATRIWEMDSKNLALQDKIAEQKYSLNSLIALMNNYHSDLDLAEYLLMLKNLRRTYDKFQLFYKKDDVEVDTANKTISAGGYFVNITEDQMREISNKIENLRTLIIH
ncbi:hypothetical protein ACFLR8_02705 [Bacteroidota bacterium]